MAIWGARWVRGGVKLMVMWRFILADDLAMGSNSATWSITVIAVIMFKSSYGFSVRMSSAFVFTIILFPSEI